MQQRRRMLPFAFPFIVSTLALALLPYVQIMPNRFNCPIIPLGGAQNGGVTRGGRTRTDADNEFSVRDATPTSFFSLRRHQLARIPVRRHQHLPQGPVIVAVPLHY